MARASIIARIPEAPDEPLPEPTPQLDSFKIFQKNKQYVVVNTLLPAKGQHPCLQEARLLCKRNLLTILLEQANILKQEILEEDGELNTDNCEDYEDEIKELKL